MKPLTNRPPTRDLEREVPAGDRPFHSLRVVWRYLPYLLPHWPKLLLILLITPLAGTVINAIIPLFSGLLIEEAFPRRNYTMVAVIVAMIAFTCVAKEINYLLEQFIRYNIKMEIFRDLGGRFYQQLLRLSLGYHTTRPVGERIFRASSDVHDASRMLGFSLPMASSMILQGLITTVIAAMIDWRPIVAIACFMPPYMIASQYATNLWRKSDRRAREMRQEVTAHLQQTLAAVHAVQASARERTEKTRYLKKLSGYLRAFYLWSLFNGLTEAYIHPAGLATFAISVIGFSWGYFYINGTMSLGQWIALQGLIANALIPLSSVVLTFQSMRREMVAAERVLEVLDIQTCVPERRGARYLTAPAGRIEFRNVSFSYHSDVPALGNVSFVIEPGSSVAFVGPSGSGKSTIMNLILRFYDPDAGQVLLDGHDLRELAADAYRRKIGVVLQNPHLFAGTVRENLVYGCPGATQADILDSIQAAQCRAFIDELPQGLETLMGEKGDLSGGQRQRLTIARALVRRPSILLLDEPLASVDVDAELKIAAALNEAAQGRTTLYATHNIFAIQHVDQIFVMDKGRIVERGRHAELLATGGLYATMTAEMRGVAQGAAKGETADEWLANTLA